MNKTLLRLLPPLAFLLILPFFLGRRPRVARRAIIRRRPEEIFPLLNDLRNWPRWTEWSRREEIHFTYDGPPSGIGAVQQWSNRKTDGILHITQSVPGHRVAYGLDMDAGKYHLEGVLSLEPVDGSTRVTWLCKWRSGSNPYSRYRDLLFRWWIGRDFERGLENLRELAERAPAWQPVA